MKRRVLMIISIITLVAMSMVLVSPTYAGSPKPPQRTIPVTGSGLIKLASDTIHKLAMKNGDEVIVPAMSMKSLKASVISETKKTLPAALPSDVVRFVDAVSVSFVQGNTSLDKLPKGSELTVSFAQDATLIDNDYAVAILCWDGTNWEEIETNSLEAKANMSGIYALVLK